MSVSRYTVTVDAIGSVDAVDIAKRRAREDGWRVRTLARVVAIDAPVEGERTRWAVELAVVRKDEP